MMQRPSGIVAIEATGDHDEATKVLFPADSPWFDGHFPGEPVLPGVALLAVVRAVLSRPTSVSTPSRRVVGFGAVRFRKLVRPDQLLDLELRPGRKAGTLSFRFTRGETLVCDGSAEWEEERSSTEGAREVPPAFFEEGEHPRAALMRAAAGLGAPSEGGTVCVTVPDRAVIAAAAVSALSSRGQVILATTSDERSREALGADTSEDQVKGEALGLPTPGGDDRVWMRLLTGGSTGGPKLFSKTVGNLLGEVELWRALLAVKPDDVVLATVSPLHIYGLIHSVLIPHLAGCRVVRETAFLPGEVERLALGHGATILVSSPAHLRAIQLSRIRLPRLRWVLSSGSTLPQGTAAEVSRQHHVPVLEIYGSTESGAIACRCRARGEERYTPLLPVRCVVEGERLRVRSPFVSPDVAVDGEGFFTMPDRVSPLVTTGFDVVGRHDDLVKIAGKRVDLNDLDRRVRTLRDVEDLVVLAVPTDGLRETDIGVLVVTTMARQQVRTLVNDALCDIVRPRWVQPVESIPRTQTGKVDTETVRALLWSLPGE